MVVASRGEWTTGHSGERVLGDQSTDPKPSQTLGWKGSLLCFLGRGWDEG